MRISESHFGFHLLVGGFNGELEPLQTYIKIEKRCIAQIICTVWIWLHYTQIYGLRSLLASCRVVNGSVLVRF